MEQKWPSTLVIVRHGESELNVAQGQALSAPGVESYGHGLRNVDASLTGKGMEQARLTGEFLSRNYNFDFIFASPYRRSVQTTQAIAQSLTGPVIIRQEERVREIEYGAIDGLTPEGLKKAYPLEYERREREGKYWYRPPGGESHPDVALRVHSFLGTLTRDCRRKNVLVVCHGVVVLMFRRLIEHWDEDTYRTVARGGDVANCSITAYRFDPQEGRLLLECFNTTAYEK